MALTQEQIDLIKKGSITRVQTTVLFGENHRCFYIGDFGKETYFDVSCSEIESMYIEGQLSEEELRPFTKSFKSLGS